MPISWPRALLAVCLAVAGVLGAGVTPAGAQSSASCPKVQRLEFKGPVERLVAVPGDSKTHDGRRVSVDVALTCDDVQVFGDVMEYWEDVDVVKVTGHVTYISGTQRITAEQLEYSLRTKLGTFWHAQGTLAMSGRRDPMSVFGVTEAEAYFFGERLEKIGDDKFRLTNGRLTTCVQPTPRWDLVASRMVLVRDKRAVLRGAVLRVKDVPILYLPWFYYPINKDDRATGFLMPSYGSDSVRGQTLSNAFFWAIARNADVTLHHEYSSKAGQGYGSEFRYIEAPGSEGHARFRMFNGNPSSSTSLLKTRTFQLDGQMVQALPRGLQFRGFADYTNNVVTQQLVQHDTNAQRMMSGSLQGHRGRLQFGAEAGITDTFNGAAAPVRYGTLPRVRLDLASAPIGQSRVYAGIASDFTALVRQDAVGDPATDRGLYRVDVSPTVRTPIGNLPYLALSAAAAYRFTYWSEQLDTTGMQIAQSLTRQLATFRAEVGGPKFSRIFDTPGWSYATRWKHVIQPSATIERRTSFKNFAKVPKNDNVDTEVGGVTTITYGLSNSVLAKRPSPDGPGAAREVFLVQLQQTYYSDASAAAYDPQYELGTATKLSPVSATASLLPSDAFSVQARFEYDTKYGALRSSGVGGNLRSSLLTVGADWSRQHYIAELPGYDNKNALYNSLNANASLRTADNRIGGTWSWSYDFQRQSQLRQRFTAHYQTQCCGIAMEYQSFNLSAFNISGLPQDHRFNFSISLGGIGTFTNLLGVFGR